MAKFRGVIGFGTSVEVRPGVWKDTIVEKTYSGNVIRNTRRLEPGENLSKDISVGNSISIVANAYANENFLAMRYISWVGTLWTIADVQVERPRLLLRLGAKYNGPKA